MGILMQTILSLLKRSDAESDRARKRERGDTISSSEPDERAEASVKGDDEKNGSSQDSEQEPRP